MYFKGYRYAVLGHTCRYMQNLLKMPNGAGNQITVLFRAKCTQGK